MSRPVSLTEKSPSCNGCFAIVNGVYYACCDNMSINNGFCTCNGGAPCTQCSPSPKDEEKVFPGSEKAGSPDLCWSWNCPSSTCCVSGKPTSCYSNPSNPCTEDCSTICGGMQCPPYSTQWDGNFEGVSNCSAIIANGNCLYSGAATGCNSLCLCLPGYKNRYLGPAFQNCVFSNRWLAYGDSQMGTGPSMPCVPI